MSSEVLEVPSEHGRKYMCICIYL